MTMHKELASEVLLFIRRTLGAGLLLVAGLIGLYFPYDTDGPPKQEAKRYYDAAYDKASSDKRYIEIAEKAASAVGIKPMVEAFAGDFSLHDKRVLEIGAGRGSLQDVVQDYTGLDVAASAAQYYHKPFVAASATAMPFPDNSFDAAWSIWVLEHISEPEKALREVRRVVKPGGVILLFPAWNCTSWAAEGYEVRPYSDFDTRGKLIKASLVLRASVGIRSAAALGVRALREAYTMISASPTRLRFTALAPNYSQYWVADSDATTSLDRYEALLWFRTRGDQCVNCRGTAFDIRNFVEPLVIRISYSK